MSGVELYSYREGVFELCDRYNIGRKARISIWDVELKGIAFAYKRDSTSLIDDSDIDRIAHEKEADSATLIGNVYAFFRVNS